MADPAENKPLLVLGVRYGERKDDPPPGLVWRKVQKDETLGTIADEYGVRWMDLALYNFHTTNLLEINWYLHHFLNCTLNNGTTYMFTGKEKGGWLLVPNIPPSVKKGPSRTVAVVRDGSAKHDTKFQVYVVEWINGAALPNNVGTMLPVSGKWLYVFSGSGGVDFGYDPPPGPTRVDGPQTAQPGSAFQLDFPGVFPIKEAPDKLEYEILVTSESGPAATLIMAVLGKRSADEPYYKVGSNWYFLPDPTILAKALTDARNTRNSHAFRNTTAVTIDLSTNRRYYFLLSPVQLGPAALKYAMANPKGLTPLLKPGDDTAQWDPKNSKGPQVDHYVGPTADDIKSGTMTLPVIDPYSWAESIAESGYPNALEEYVKWLGINSKASGKSETIAKLTSETSWGLDHLYVAQILKSVRDSHKKPGSIDDELKDAAQSWAYLDKWEKGLVVRNAEINANVHRQLMQLTEWLAGPAHAIIEPAVLKDTSNDTPQDAIDLARGILHWAVCTEHMIALEPGLAFLRDLFGKPGSVPTDVVMAGLNVDALAVKMSKVQETAFKYASQGALMLFALKDFVSPPPSLNFNGTREDYLKKLGEYEAARRDKLIAILNDSKLLPAKIQVPALNLSQSQSQKLQVAATATNSMLDAADKWTTYVIDPNIEIPRKFGLNWLANLEQWFEKRPTFAKFANMGTSYALKGTSLILNGYNLYSVITTARFDYQTQQMTSTAFNYTQAGAGAALAVQDVLAEMGTLLKNQTMQRIFPQLMTTSGGPTWGVGAARVTGIAGTTFAAINVVAMIVSGITTMISMERSRGKALSRGDYTAAKFYAVGVAGGALMVAGGIAFGLALMEVGGIFSASGIGAVVGVVLFLIGGIIATIASIIAWWKSTDDDYQVFARKCFLGRQSDEEPRFDDDPPDWSHALAKGSDTWPIDKQKRAIHNLVGRFTLKTSVETLNHPSYYQGRIMYDITPGVFMPASTLEVAIGYGKKGEGQQTSATIEWDPDGPAGHDYQVVQVNANGLFTPGETDIYYGQTNGALNKIKVWANKVNYDADYGDLVTTVTVRYPNLPNTIRVRKLVISVSGDELEADSDEVASGLYV